ncbi:uncharacterized protein LOC107040705 [Diachasma alloeum]|uniref:uncharacterized protein LOC107040705 n=1 Tax=Diachasma alloeum TaxID=454923 RepID=UPI0007383D32|nr:uncharacterized protein LOC107040705 [Diachasma alloeum]
MTYQLIHKPIVSNWTMSRCSKIAFTFVGLVIVSLSIVGKSRDRKIREIYALQDRIADILDLELQYMARQAFTEGDEWIPLDNISGHIYSVYLDTRPEVIVKYSNSEKSTWGELIVTALLPTKTQSEDLTCVLQYEDNERKIMLRKVPARVRILNEHWDLEYSAFLVVCDLTYLWAHDYEFFYNFKQLPEAVGIGGGGQFVDVHYPKEGLNQFYGGGSSIAVCVPVLHHNFDRPLELIEFIEYYEMMGIDHFTIYNSSVSPDVDKVLEYYKLKLTATVLNWTLPSIYVYEQTLRHQGLFAALNDCLYRNTHHHRYKYVATFDVDEFLVPRRHDNIRELMNELDSSPDQSEFAGFIFRNVYFYTMYEDDERAREKEPYLYTRAKTKRLKKPHKARERSRYIVRGRDTVEIGSYNVWEFRAGSLMSSQREFKELVVDPEIALLHHYAPCEAEETGCYLKAIEIDDTAVRFSEGLGRRVGKVCSEIFGRGGCPPPKRRTIGSE